MILTGKNFKKHRFRQVSRALLHVIESKPISIVAEFDDRQRVSATTQVVLVTNSPLIGKNILIAPGAKMDDGLLECWIIDGMDKPELLNLVTRTLLDKQAPQPNVKVKVYHARRVRIYASAPMGAHSGQHVMAQKRVWEIEAVSAALSVIVGNGTALTVPVESAPPACQSA